MVNKEYQRYAVFEKANWSKLAKFVETKNFWIKTIHKIIIIPNKLKILKTQTKIPNKKVNEVILNFYQS